MSRRDFMRAAVVAGAGLGLAALPGCGGGGATAPAAPVATSSTTVDILADLSSRLAGPVLLPGSPGFAAASQPNNLRYAGVTPMAIARCANEVDVSTAIAWARQYGLPLVPRCGGHNYAGYSTTTGLLIDMSMMSSISFDAASGTVTIGGGVINNSLYAALAAANAAITHGRCPSVGASGFLLGGGIGFNMRGHGMACDQLLQTRVVLADGSRVTASATENADLFWACRGGAGRNFGINTSFTLQTFAAPALTVFSIAWNTQQAAVLRALTQALDAAPDTLGSRVSVVPVSPAQYAAGHDFALSVIGQIAGTPQELAAILAPVYAVAAPSSSTIQQMSYWNGQAFLEEAGLPDRYQERSRFYGPLTDAFLDSVVQQARLWPGSSEPGEIKFFQTGGAVNQVSSDATAFVHRDSHWLMSISVAWGASEAQTVIDANLAWQASAYTTLITYTSGGAFQNFPDPSLADWADAYYQGNLTRLRMIKRAVDPTFFFQFPQAISPL